MTDTNVIADDVLTEATPGLILPTLSISKSGALTSLPQYHGSWRNALVDRHKRVSKPAGL
jgi:hypothetical protein